MNATLAHRGPSSTTPTMPRGALLLLDECLYPLTRMPHPATGTPDTGEHATAAS